MARTGRSQSSSSGNGMKLARRHRQTGAVEPRKRGRPSPDYENGFLNEAGEFVAGEPPQRRGRRGRPAGSGRSTASRTGSARRVTGGLSEIETIIRREVDARLRSAREEAVAAISRALS